MKRNDESEELIRLYGDVVETFGLNALQAAMERVFASLVLEPPPEEPVSKSLIDERLRAELRRMLRPH